MDDFGVVWKNRADLDHLISTLTKLYQVKVDVEGSKYLGIPLTEKRDMSH